jgi:hypothetical protein
MLINFTRLFYHFNNYISPQILHLWASIHFGTFHDALELDYIYDYHEGLLYKAHVQCTHTCGATVAVVFKNTL